MSLLFWGGIFVVFMRSLGMTPPYAFADATLRFYETVSRDESFAASFVLTARVAAMSSLAAGLLGSMIALLASLSTRSGWGIRLVLNLPLFTPYIVAAQAIVLLLSQSGLLSRIFYGTGILSDMMEFPTLFYDELGLGASLGLAFKETPFVALMVFPYFLASHRTYGSVAKTLGVGLWLRLVKIYLPAAMPAIAISVLICFTYGFTAFEVPRMLGRTYPQVLSSWSYDLYMGSDPEGRSLAPAIGMVIVSVNAISAYVFFCIFRRLHKRLAITRAGSLA